MAITYQVEKYHEICDEIHKLWQEQWEELSFDQEVIKLDPDYEKFKVLSESGITHLVTVRENGVVVGYHHSFIYNHLHFKTSLTCFTDMFFIKKENRKGFIGINFLKFIEKSIKDLGVKKIYISHTVHINLEPILKRLKYQKIETSYSKLIG